ncbi:MAG TPA: DUF465 domain-containing protein [Alphaproteobacteria bacterium]|nr:GTP-binding protein [Rhodospirillaceae bacterium]HRJ66840.1 DUF465 domain-containing protein [Alphaproteobacteria bacterium]
MGTHHDLAQDFPELKDDIHAMKMADAHFRRLAEEYEAVCKELHRAQDGAGVMDDAHAEELKKQRVTLKDDLFAMLRLHQAAQQKAAV